MKKVITLISSTLFNTKNTCVILCFLITQLLGCMNGDMDNRNMATPQKIEILFYKHDYDWFLHEYCGENFENDPIVNKNVRKYIKFTLGEEEISQLIDLMRNGKKLPSPLKAAHECEMTFYYDGDNEEIYEVSLSSHIFRNKKTLNKNIQVDSEKLLWLVKSIVQKQISRISRPTN